MINFKLISYITIILICSGIAIADQKVINSEDDFKAGSFSNMQLNRNPMSDCDASRYIQTGYDYPDTNTNPSELVPMSPYVNSFSLLPSCLIHSNCPTSLNLRMK